MAPKSAIESPFECVDRRDVARPLAGLIAVALFGYRVHQVLKSIMTMRSNLLAKVVESFAEEMLHLLGRFVEQVVDIAKLQSIESNFDLFRPQYLDLRGITVTAKMRREPGLFDLLQGIVFTVGV